MKKKDSGENFYILIAIVSVILGFLITTSVINQERTYSRTPLSRKEELVKVIKDTEKEREKLKIDIKTLREHLEIIEKKAAEEEGILSAYTYDLDRTRETMGLEEKVEEGLIVSLNDNPAVPLGEDPNDYIIHDYDLRIIINALWRGGAKAVAINDQRVVFTSAIRCAGSTILTNSKRLSLPYEIKAIGNPEDMIESLNDDFNASLLIGRYAQAFGLQIDIREEAEVVIPGYDGSLNIKYAQINEGK